MNDVKDCRRVSALRDVTKGFNSSTPFLNEHSKPSYFHSIFLCHNGAMTSAMTGAMTGAMVHLHL